MFRIGTKYNTYITHNMLYIDLHILVYICGSCFVFVSRPLESSRERATKLIF